MQKTDENSYVILQHTFDFVLFNYINMNNYSFCLYGLIMCIFKGLIFISFA